MNTLFNLVLSFYFLLTPLYSVSAPPFPFEVEQPDGSKIPVRMFGHEYYNWMETEDGYVIDWIEDDERLGWYYSELDEDGKFTSSEILVTFPASDDLNLAKHLREISPKVRDLSYRLPNTEMDSHNHLNRGVLDNTLKPLVFLVDFNDEDHVYTEDHFQQLLFAENLSPADFPSDHEDYTMSVRDYYDEISNGKQEIIGDIESIRPWRPAKENYSYYVDGANGTGEGDYGKERSAAALVMETATAMDNEGFDFSQFDNGKGFIDVVILIVAGKGGNQNGNYFWPHMYVVQSSDPNSDYFSVAGVNIHKYIVFQERYPFWANDDNQTKIHPIGTICHELGHVLGLPDLYDNSDSPASGIGYWGLMGAGNYNTQTSPAYMSAWSRYRLGFIVPDTLSDVYNLEITIPPAEFNFDDRAAYILPMSSNFPQEYLMIENRQNDPNSSDKDLIESGLLVWHIDETITDMYPVFSSSVNIDPHFYGVNLLQADGYGNLYTNDEGDGDSGDPFYGNAEITSSTNPNTNLYTYDRDADGFRDGGDASNISLINIRETANNSITLTAHNPNQQGIVLAYDEGGYAGIGYPDSYSSLQWVGIRVVAPDNAMLSGIRTVFPALVTDYIINIWKDWIGDKPAKLLYSLNGDVNWTERDGGWVHISLAEVGLILNQGDTYYVEINYNGFGGVYPLDQGNYSSSQADGMSYFRGNTIDNCTPLTDITDGDWNIRVSLNPDFCNSGNDGGIYDCDSGCTFETDCAGECGGSAVVDECGICSGPGAIYDCGCQDLAEFACDCNGNIEDCVGVCGGSTVVDECGVCGGNGLNCMEINPNMVPDQFNLFQNYPNPFNPTTQIRYDISQYSMVSLKIYDITGRLVTVLFNGYQSPGQYTQIWNGSGYSSGLYFLELNISSENKQIYREIKKILFIQ